MKRKDVCDELYKKGFKIIYSMILFLKKYKVNIDIKDWIYIKILIVLIIFGK